MYFTPIRIVVPWGRTLIADFNGMSRANVKIPCADFNDFRVSFCTNIKLCIPLLMIFTITGPCHRIILPPRFDLWGVAVVTLMECSGQMLRCSDFNIFVISNFCD